MHHFLPVASVRSLGACFAALWSVLQGGHLGGQPGGQLGQPLHAPPAFAEPSQPLERRFRSLSNPSPSSLMFGKAASLLPNPFAQFSSIPLQGKLGDPAGLLNRPVRRRTPLPDLMGGVDPHLHPSLTYMLNSAFHMQAACTGIAHVCHGSLGTCRVPQHELTRLWIHSVTAHISTMVPFPSQDLDMNL